MDTQITSAQQELWSDDRLGELATFVAVKVAEVRAFHDHALDTLETAVRAAYDHVSARVQAGKSLLELKHRLSKHGTWGDFLRFRMPWIHERTAQRYMDEAKKALAGQLNIERPGVEYLQLAFDGIDFHPKGTESQVQPQAGKTAKPTTVSYLPRFDLQFWRFIERTPLSKWPAEEKDNFAADTARRVKLLDAEGIPLPPVIDLEPPTPKWSIDIEAETITEE